METPNNFSSDHNSFSVNNSATKDLSLEDVNINNLANQKTKEHSFVDPEHYKKLQEDYNQLQSKFDKKKIIYTKINKGLKVISSYLNKKKKLEAERKKQNKQIHKDTSHKAIKRHHHLTSPPSIQNTSLIQSGDYNDYNFSEADYENTTNNDTTPRQSLKDKLSPTRGKIPLESITGSSNHVKSNKEEDDDYNRMKVKFDKPSLQKHHKREPKTHKRLSSNNLILENGNTNNALFEQNENSQETSAELLDFLDHEDLTNLKELEELNRLLNGDFVSDNQMGDYGQQMSGTSGGRYCESCGENVETDYDSGVEETTSSDSDDMSSDDISVSGMSGWSGLSGLSNNKTEDYDFENTDDEDEESDKLTDQETEKITLIKSKKSIQFDTQGEVNNQQRIHQHKANKKSKLKSSKVKNLDIDDYSMSDSSLPISRITTQNTNNSQIISAAEDSEVEEKANVIHGNKEALGSLIEKPKLKQSRKQLTHSSKSRQYDAIKELHRKAIRMYKKKLLKKKQRLKIKGQKEKQPTGSSVLKPIEEILDSNLGSESRRKISVPAISIESTDAFKNTIQNQPIFSPNMINLPQASFSNGSQLHGSNFTHTNQLGSIMTPQLNNGGLVTPYKDGQIFFAMGQLNGNGSVMPNANSSNNSGMYQINTPMLNMFLQNPATIVPATNSMVDSPSGHIASIDSNSIVSPVNLRTHLAVSPKFSNLRSPNIMGNNYLKYDSKKQAIISPNYNFNPLSPIYSDTNSEIGHVREKEGSVTGSTKTMNNVIQQFAGVYLHPDKNKHGQDLSVTSTTNSSVSSPPDKPSKSKKAYTKSKIILPPEFESRELITENDLLEIYDLKLSEKIKNTVDIWVQYHEITGKQCSFERLDLEFGKKWKIKCEPKFIKKYNRRYLLIKSIKMAMQRDGQDDPYVYLNKLDKTLAVNKKPISYFYKKSNLPLWLLPNVKKDSYEDAEYSE
ncbi:hypothetical protein QEN19_004155 [Hanseniaspora menglaensis]